MPPQKPSVLIIEDSVDYGGFLVAILAKEGIDARHVCTGEEGVRLAAQQTFDLILLDLGLPDMDGFEVCRQFKKIEVLRSIPIIIITARDSTEDKVKGFDLGANDYINKSFDRAELRARILAVLRTRHSQEVWAQVANRERQRTQQDHLRISKAVDAASDAICIADEVGRQIYQNHSFLALFEYAQEELQEEQALRRLFVDHHVWELIWDFCRSGNSWRGEAELQTRSGVVVSALCRADAILDEHNKIIGSVCIFTDVSERKRLERDLVFLATHDPLTNLPNRRIFQDVLEGAVARAKRGQSSSLLYLDLDNFKIINDTLGHPSGDRLLLKIASLLQEHTREEDALARLGGDEFALLLINSSRMDAERVAAKLVHLIDDFRFVEKSQSLWTSASIGIVLIDGSSTADEVLAHADAACFSAKGKGRNRYEFYRTDNTEIHRMNRESSWMVVIKDALRENRFELWFQPIIPLQSRERRFWEVLLRLRDERGNIILPGAFIPAAERFGAMMAIDRMVIQRAVGFLQCRSDLCLSINLSATSLNDPDLASLIESLLVEGDVQPDRLTFEITESAIIMNLSRARAFILKIKELGCSFALDDFGSGFTSLSYLRDLPVDYLKIDGSFVQHVDTDLVNRALVKSMNEVVHTLGKKTVAENVVTARVLAVIKELQIDYAQGWYIAEPAPSADFLRGDFAGGPLLDAAGGGLLMVDRSIIEPVQP
jgi:diguanylate cyclase (GGDEF)-like protein/PAS domain S-box-containing protein